MKCRNIGKNLGLFFLTAGALLGLLVLSALIPRSAIRDRMRASAAYLCSGEQFPMELRGVQASQIDRYADSILMGIAWQYDREHPLSSVLLSSYYDSEEKSVSGSLLEALEEDRAANQQYFRYWHGSIALVRPLLTVLSLRGIYIFNGAALAALWGGLLTAILRRRAYVPAAGALAGLAAVSVWFVPLCMEYVWVFLTAAAAGLAVVRQAEAPAPPGKARKPFRDGEARDASDAGVAGLFLVVGTVRGCIHTFKGLLHLFRRVPKEANEK